MMPSVPQLLIILVIVVLIFGAKRLRNLGGDLGSAVKGFKNAVKDESADADPEDDADPAKLANQTDKPVRQTEKPAADAAAMREQEEQKKSA